MAEVSLKAVLDKFVDNENRDDSDRLRYMELYGFHDELDYRFASLYDLIVDTSDHSPADSLVDVLHFLKNHPVGIGFLQEQTVMENRSN